MSHVLTLIGAPGARDIVEAIAEDFRSSVGASHEPFWLSPEACDITFRAANEDAMAAARAVVDAIPPGAPVDKLIQPVEGRRKRMLVADMDSTIIQQECLDEVAGLAGIGPKIAAITDRAMRGELPFEDALRERIALLAGFPEAKLQEVLDLQIALTPGARQLAETMRAHGARTVLVSGGFTFFTRCIAERAGFDVDYGNRFIIENGMVTGVADPILGQNAKLEAMSREAVHAGIGLKEVIAVGDGANDLAMLKAAGLGVAYHAKPIVAAEAKARIDHGDLTALLFLQGYRVEDFASQD
ncbi:MULTISPECIES: phosphoserine phosphatase SerB [Rhodomicrobium]|uniref:phosphoserine phosphatase SerB n=1 Tax=Rhodomicrobium TaxID=1068 RepID=UPI000B4B4A15|nr:MULTISPECIES: phosphoserine phosphatase SerB [Rhodomicrobium]